MSDTPKPLIPRPIVIICAALGITASIVIGIVAFLLPAQRTRRDYQFTQCTAISATLSCTEQCRNLTLSAPPFPSPAFLIRYGRGNAPCDSIETCDERLPCRYNITSDGIVVRENVSAFPSGLTLFIVLAAIQATALLLYLLHECLVHYGVDLLSDDAVRVVVFLPMGVDASAVIHAITSRWPKIEARGLTYRTHNEGPRQVEMEARDAFSTPAERYTVGLVFCVSADGRNDEAVFNAVPESFYRVLVLPQIADCVHAACGDMKEDPVVGEVLTEQISPQEGSRVSIDEVEKTYRGLLAMLPRFDSVYTVGSWHFDNHVWIARSVSPYVPLRVAFTSQWVRNRMRFSSILGQLLQVICCSRKGPRGDRDDQSSQGT